MHKVPEKFKLMDELFTDWITLVEQDLADGNKDATDLYDRCCDYLGYARVVEGL